MYRRYATVMLHSYTNNQHAHTHTHILIATLMFLASFFPGDVPPILIVAFI